MTSWLDTIAGRTLVLLIGALIVSHLASLYLYRHGLETELDLANVQRLAERLVSVKRAIANEVPSRREKLAHSLAGSPIDVHWSETQIPRPRELTGAAAQPLRTRLLEADSDLNGRGLLVGAMPVLPEHLTGTQVLLVSMQLGDGTWTNVTIATAPEARPALREVLMSTTLMVLGVTVAAGFLIWPLTRSLTSLAAAADRSYRKAEPVIAPEKGPREVRALGAAFNAMQGRVKRFVDDRTQVLAAISHDLRTPLTRLRLRAEDIGDGELAQRIESDVAEMETMIDGALDFLRGEAMPEPAKPLDLAPLLETICTGLADAGHDVSLAAPGGAVVKGRRIALKRALSNLIENAIKYGARARVTLRAASGMAEILIEDDGPGIPEDEIEAVMEPFYRVERSRNKETGGAGLGLTIAHTVIAAHGGSLTLSNRETGGLRALVILPKTPKTALT